MVVNVIVILLLFALRLISEIIVRNTVIIVKNQMNKPNSLPSQQIICPHPIKWISKDGTMVYCDICEQEFTMPKPKPTPQQIEQGLERFKELFSEIAVKKSGEEYYALILPKDIHEHDEYGLPDIEAFLKQELEACAESARKEAVEEMITIIENQFVKQRETDELFSGLFIRTENWEELKDALSQPKGEDK